MGVIFTIGYGQYDYNNFQTVHLKIEIKNWVHHFGCGYIHKHRILERDNDCSVKLHNRFWRYIGAA